MKKTFAILVMATVLCCLSTQAQYKVITWYEMWCEQPLGSNGYGIPPWQANWNGIDVIVHFDNQNVNNNASPYWGYMNKGNSGVDSVYLFYGAFYPNENPQKNYVDSLVSNGHAAGAAVVMGIMDINGDHIITLANDSTLTDVFCTAVAQWCERHNYDGVDVNWENSANFATKANGNRFVRILRRKLTRYLTTPFHTLSRPWLSLTCPPEAYGPNAMFSIDIKDSVDMVCAQQGTAQWVWNPNLGSNIIWYGAALQIGSTTEAQAGQDTWITSISEDASWIPSTNKPTGIRQVNQTFGWPKNKIAPAFSIGGGSVMYGGTGTLFSAISSVTNDRARNVQKDLLTHGGTWKWDSVRVASYISGTATSAIGSMGIPSGAKFFAPTPDSAQCYNVSRWLIDNGWGGVAPYSVQFDVDPTLPFSSRLPSHRGLIAAKTPVVPSAPTAATSAATVITQTTATLNGTVSANGSSTTVRFVYGTVAGTYTDSVVAAQSPVVGNLPVSIGIAGLTASRTYYYRVRAYNALGSVQGSEVSFTTSAPPSAPTATTSAATAITQTTATLNGTVNGNGTSTTVRFVWGTVAGTYTDSIVAAQSPVTGNVAVSGAITGLTAGRTYYYRVRAYNVVGSVQGSEMSFATSAAVPPTAATSAATVVTQTTATLNGTVNGNGTSTTVRFVYGTVAGTYTDSAVAAQSPVTGNVAVSSAITGLTSARTYYYRVRAYNTLGSAQGGEMSFTTQLPGGQGEQDITSQASAPIALITQPTGTGNPDIETIRDGNMPPVGSSDPMQQYDTYNGGGPRPLDWIGYQFSATHTFTHMLFQEGINSANGGWFTTLGVQVRVSGLWTDVPNVQCTPAYTGGNGINYESFDLTFVPISGDGIRIAGVPGGSGSYISVGELRVYEPQSGPPDGLVAAYGFEEGTGTTAGDVSGNGLNGTISGGTWTTQGKYGNALSFNGTTSYVDLGNPAALQITGSMSWSAWVKAFANPPDDGEVVAKSNGSSGSQLKSSPDTGPHTFGVAISAGSGGNTQRYSTTTRTLNTWYHIAGVYNASLQTLDIYVNGLLDDGTLVGTVPSSQYMPGVNVNIGRRTGGYYFNGIIDEVRIYNRALTQAEVQSDMNTPLATLTVPVAPVLVSPADLAGNQPINILLRWRMTAGATSYQVQVATDSLFGSLIINDSTIVDSMRQVSSLSYQTRYFWRARAKNSRGYGAFSPRRSFSTTDPTGVVGEELPGKYLLGQNFPNPFNPTTMVPFDLPVGVYVSLKVYDLLGQEVASLVDGFKEAGHYSVEFSSAGVGSGVYFYILNAGGFSQTKKMVLLR